MESVLQSGSSATERCSSAVAALCPGGQIHHVQSLQPVIKLLRGATAFIRNRDFFGGGLRYIPHPSCCSKGRRLNECPASEDLSSSFVDLP